MATLPGYQRIADFVLTWIKNWYPAPSLSLGKCLQLFPGSFPHSVSKPLSMLVPELRENKVLSLVLGCLVPQCKGES